MKCRRQTLPLASSGGHNMMVALYWPYYIWHQMVDTMVALYQPYYIWHQMVDTVVALYQPYYLWHQMVDTIQW